MGQSTGQEMVMGQGQGHLDLLRSSALGSLEQIRGRRDISSEPVVVET